MKVDRFEFGITKYHSLSIFEGLKMVIFDRFIDVIVN